MSSPTGVKLRTLLYITGAVILTLVSIRLYSFGEWHLDLHLPDISETYYEDECKKIEEQIEKERSKQEMDKEFRQWIEEQRERERCAESSTIQDR